VGSGTLRKLEDYPWNDEKRTWNREKESRGSEWNTEKKFRCSKRAVAFSGGKEASGNFMDR